MVVVVAALVVPETVALVVRTATFFQLVYSSPKPSPDVRSHLEQNPQFLNRSECEKKLHSALARHPASQAAGFDALPFLILSPISAPLLRQQSAAS